jgi:hypothetical protein
MNSFKFCLLVGLLFPHCFLIITNFHSSSLFFFVRIFLIAEKRHIVDERKALDDALTLVEQEGLLHGNKIGQVHDYHHDNNDNNHKYDPRTEEDNGMKTSPPPPPGVVLYLSKLSEPNIDDITMYGVLRSIEGFTVHNDIILDETKRPYLVAWYRLMSRKTGKEM